MGKLSSLGWGRAGYYKFEDSLKRVSWGRASISHGVNFGTGAHSNMHSIVQPGLHLCCKARKFWVDAQCFQVAFVL